MTKDGHAVKEDAAATAGGGAGAVREGGTGAPGDEEIAREAGTGTSSGGSAVREAGAGAADDGGPDREAGAGTPEGRNASREGGASNGEDDAGADCTQARSAASETPVVSPENALAEARRAAQENLDRALSAQAEV